MSSAASLKYPSTIATKDSEPPSESKVDHDSHFNGLYETKQDLRVEGIAEGEIRCEGTLTVAEGARVKAKVTASTITIAGELEGEVSCQGVFQIMPTGQVSATVSARRISIQEGGFFNGEFHMMTDEPGLARVDTVRDTSPAAVTPLGGNTGEAQEHEDTIGSDQWWAKMTGTPLPEKDADSESDTA